MENKESLKWLRLTCYIGGIILVLGSILYGFNTIGNDFFSLKIDAAEKKEIIMTVASGIVLIVEGWLIINANNQEKSILKWILCILSVVSFIINIIFQGIGQFFSFIGIMNFAFYIINILILIFILRDKNYN